MKYLIAYDICHPRRLRRVARLLEKHAIRCQKSVFIFRGRAEQLTAIMDQLAKLIEPNLDLVQAWQLAPREAARGVQRGHCPVLFPQAVVLSRNQVHTIEESES